MSTPRASAATGRAIRNVLIVRARTDLNTSNPGKTIVLTAVKASRGAVLAAVCLEMLTLWRFRGAELLYLQCVAWSESSKDTPAALWLRHQPVTSLVCSLLLPVPWTMFSRVLHPSACCIPGDAARVLPRSPDSSVSVGRAPGWGGFGLGGDVSGQLWTCVGEFDPAKGDHSLQREIFSARLPLQGCCPGRGDLPWPFLQKHSACLQKPSGKLLGEEDEGGSLCWIFWHFPDPEPATHPLFRHRDPLVGDR